MPDRRVFCKILRFIDQINTNNDKIINQQELQKAVQNKSVPSIWLDAISKIANGEDVSVDRVIMGLGVEHTEEMDKDHTPFPESDGCKYRFRFEGETEDEAYRRALEDAKFFIERNVEKWLSIDSNSDGYASNVEEAMWARKNVVPDMNDGDLNEKEFAKKYNLFFMLPMKSTSFKEWIADWKQYVIYNTAYDFGVELKDEDIKALEDYAVMQLNRKLVKEGSSLYNRMGQDAYTRIITTEAAVSCCGGDVTPPPMVPVEGKDSECMLAFSALEPSLKEWKEADEKGVEIDLSKYKNTSEEVKNRLAWAAFRTPPEELLDRSENAVTVWNKMSNEDYEYFHNQWVELRSMTAADFRELQKPENKHKLKEFEKYSTMSVRQIVEYIDIVEAVTGKDFDSDDWEISHVQFMEICERVNGTYGDETVLDGKTKADVLPERKALYKYLEKNDLLLEQFK